ncbi:high-affinity Zn(2+) transporter zrt1 [Tilletia horrida]|nr:high-affinity Zn(2+) transporter zrt1 [Tilletia horrida]
MRFSLIALAALLSAVAAVPQQQRGTAVIGRQVATQTSATGLVPPSPTGQGICTLHIDHWDCEGEEHHDHEQDHDHGAEQQEEAAATPTATGSPSPTADSAVVEPSPTGQGECHLHGDHWHCELNADGTPASEEQQEAGHEGHDHSGDSHAGHDHAGHSHGPSEEYGCGLAPLQGYNLGLAIGAIFILLAVSLLGVLLPGVSGYLNSRIDSRGADANKCRSAIAWAIFALQHFGGGVILSTAFVHLLAHAALYFNNSCIGELQYEATSPAIAMAAIWLMFAIDFFALRPLRQRVLRTAGIVPAGCCGNGDAFGQHQLASARHLYQHPDDEKHSTGSSSSSHHDAASLEAAQHATGRLAKYEVLALEAGIIFHSIIIGVSVGTSGGPGWRAFLIAIAFHQFCEGVALASRIALLPTTGMVAKILMYAAFVVTTPVGTAIGVGVRQTFNGNDRDTLLAIGTLNSISAGILIYAALVQIIAGEFIYNRSMLTAPASRGIIAFAFFTLGALIMSVLGKWA